MGVTLRELDSEHLADVDRCDNTFIVEGKLVLSAEDGAIRYRVEGLPPYLKRYPPDAFDPAAYIANPDKAIYLAYVDGQLAGQIRVGKYWNHFAYIEDIVVDPPYRKQGVGRALMQQAIEWARAKEFAGVMLETQDNNLAGCRLYESCGMMLGGFDTCLYRDIEAVRGETALFWYLVF